MFNKIINNTLLISSFAVGGGLINYFHNVLFKNKYEKYYKTYDNSLIYNNGFFIGGLIGVVIGYLRCPIVLKIPLNQTPKLEN